MKSECLAFQLPRSGYINTTFCIKLPKHSTATATSLMETWNLDKRYILKFKKTNIIDLQLRLDISGPIV